MFSIVIAFIIGVLAGIFGMTAAINKHRKYIAEVSREIAEREWNDGSRSSRRRFKAE